ncbi:MAG TPA: hypothetical protein PKD55_00150 [Bellilinea sp.]|nr:hypothetical protein [Bellilinea sp.]
MGVTEERFRQGTGERYLRNGKVRCQSIAKGKLRRLREQTDNPDLTADEAWPIAQCEWPAVEGTFACELHGGASPAAQPKSLLDFMPVDLREMAREFEQNPDVTNQRDAIIALMSRNSQLFQELYDTLSTKAIKKIWGYLDMIEEGDVVRGVRGIQSVIKATQEERETWGEFRQNVTTIGKMIETQMKVFEKMQQIATVDQVLALLEGITEIMESVVNSYIEDQSQRDRIMLEFSRRAREKVGTAGPRSIDFPKLSDTND